MADTTLTSQEINGFVDNGGISDEFLEILSEPDTSDGVIMLLEITHENLKSAIRLTSNPNQFLDFHKETKEPVFGLIFNGQTYLWCAFTFILVNDPETGALGGASISIENVDPIMTATLREIETAPRFDIALLRKNDISKAEMVVDYLKLINVTITVSTIQGDLSDYNYLSEPIPPDKYTPSFTKGLF